MNYDIPFDIWSFLEDYGGLVVLVMITLVGLIIMWLRPPSPPGDDE